MNNRFAAWLTSFLVIFGMHFYIKLAALPGAICLCVCLSVCLSVFLSVCLSACLSVSLSIYPFLWFNDHFCCIILNVMFYLDFTGRRHDGVGGGVEVLEDAADQATGDAAAAIANVNRHVLATLHRKYWKKTRHFVSTTFCKNKR